MNGWTMVNGEAHYFVGFDGIEYWFESVDREWNDVSFTFAREVDGEPDDLISPSDIDGIPEHVHQSLDEANLTLRTSATSLSEVMG